MLACLCCLAYAGLFMIASYKWVTAVMGAHIGAEDLDQYGIDVGDIVVIVPIGFAMVFIRYLEIFYRIFTTVRSGWGWPTRPVRPASWPAAMRSVTDGRALSVSAVIRVHVSRRADCDFPGTVRRSVDPDVQPGFGEFPGDQAIRTSDAYTFLAIPFFLLSGAFMTTGGVAQRLIDFANACVGHIRGGLAIAAVLACMLFAALSGSSPATVAAVGSIAVAGMVRSGYPKAFGAGIICNAGTLGILIPPSIVMVVYSAATETSVGKLFMAGVIPGLLLGLMLMIAIYIVARIKKLPAQPRATFREWLTSARRAFWGLLLLVIILGGIYSGMFTPTEAAAVAAVYSAFVALFIYKDMQLRDCPKVLLESGRLAIMLMFIIANAMLFAHVLTTEQIPQEITAWVLSEG
ncbi:tripartite ATP-independent periplasmic transporter, dctM component domain-containing protein [Ditylenchus destructor]|nr:tripartite ATP-independent periplasmic transporter, dctM component domain-containing protein [Ditylenchus destructor]